MAEFEYDDELVDDDIPYVHQFTRQSAADDYSDPESRPFGMMPGKRKRTVLHWVFFAAHVLPFAALIFAYASLSDSNPELFASNLAWLVIPIWGLIVLAHLAIVALIDLRESLAFMRYDRRRRRINDASTPR